MKRPAAFPHLETSRLVLREPEDRDVHDLFTVFSNAEVMRYWSTPPMTSPAEMEAVIARSRTHLAEGSGYRWAIEHRADARAIGTLSLFAFSEQNDRAEIGYGLGRPYWGSGLMNEALTAVIDFAFGTMELRRIEADTDPRNAPSVRALQRLGFQLEGTLRERWVVAGEISDTAFLGLLRRDWEARRKQA